MKGIIIVSGGLDSTVLAYELARLHDVDMLSFNYGQRHLREIDFAAVTADRLGIRHEVVGLPIGHLLEGSALTDRDIEIPEGHYEWDSMKATVVPNRNAIMLSVATAAAVARDADFVATAVHAGDHAVYPDCRPEFIQAFQAMARLANQGFIREGFAVQAPYVELTKAWIVKRGHSLGVPWTETWSCYVGGASHCGACSTCFERREAFTEAGIEDPTTYLATPTYAP